MSLEDKLYPEDGSYLTKFDNFMIKSAGKIGEAYQHVTGRSYKDLVASCYKVSTAGFGVGTLCLRPVSMLLGLVSLASIIDKPTHQSPLEEEIEMEAQGKDRKTGKGRRTGLLLMIPILFGSSYVLSNYGLELSNNGQKYLGAIFYYSFGMGGIVEGITLLPFSFADYLTKSHIPKPPEKTVWDRAKEKMDEFFAPAPLPQPLPVSYRMYV